MFKAIQQTLRQWMYPPEFRIASPELSAELLRELKQLSGTIEKWPTPPAAVTMADAPAPVTGPPPRDKEQDKLLANLATSAWRINRAVTTEDDGTNLPASSRATRRHVESIIDQLSQNGVEIEDHTGQIVPDYGAYGLKVLAYQPTAGINRETVIETVKPSVYRNGEMIQIGEVIVGTPE